MARIEYPHPQARSNELGIFFKNGGQLTADVELDHLFTFIRVRTAGDVNLINENGDTFLLIDAQPGEYHPAVCKGFASSGTTATGIFWYGGGQ